LLKQSSN